MGKNHQSKRRREKEMLAKKRKNAMGKGLQKNHMSILDLQKQTGISNFKIRAFANGQFDLPEQELEDVARVLGVPKDDLLVFSADEPIEQAEAEISGAAAGEETENISADDEDAAVPSDEKTETPAADENVKEAEAEPDDENTKDTEVPIESGPAQEEGLITEPEATTEEVPVEEPESVTKEPAGEPEETEEPVEAPTAAADVKSDVEDPDTNHNIELVRTGELDEAYILNLLKNINRKDENEMKKSVDHILREIERLYNKTKHQKWDIMKGFVKERFLELDPEADIVEAYKKYDLESFQADIEAYAAANNLTPEYVCEVIEYFFKKNKADPKETAEEEETEAYDTKEACEETSSNEFDLEAFQADVAAYAAANNLTPEYVCEAINYLVNKNKAETKETTEKTKAEACDTEKACEEETASECPDDPVAEDEPAETDSVCEKDTENCNDEQVAFEEQGEEEACKEEPSVNTEEAIDADEPVTEGDDLKEETGECNGEEPVDRAASEKEHDDYFARTAEMLHPSNNQMRKRIKFYDERISDFIEAEDSSKDIAEAECKDSFKEKATSFTITIPASGNKYPDKKDLKHMWNLMSDDGKAALIRAGWQLLQNDAFRKESL